MVYQYNCQKCGHQFDVTKSVKDMDVNENCPECGEFATREFVPTRVHLSKTAVQHAEYNPGLGRVVKNSQHRAELCKRMGVVEIGNDFKSPEKIHKQFDAERKQKREKKWEDA